MLCHSEFIFVYGVRECSHFILLLVAVQFSQHHLLKRLSFLLKSTLRRLQQSIWKILYPLGQGGEIGASKYHWWSRLITSWMTLFSQRPLPLSSALPCPTFLLTVWLRTQLPGLASLRRMWSKEREPNHDPKRALRPRTGGQIKHGEVWWRELLQMRAPDIGDNLQESPEVGATITSFTEELTQPPRSPPGKWQNKP